MKFEIGGIYEVTNFVDYGKTYYLILDIRSNGEILYMEGGKEKRCTGKAISLLGYVLINNMYFLNASITTYSLYSNFTKLVTVIDNKKMKIIKFLCNNYHDLSGIRIITDFDKLSDSEINELLVGISNYNNQSELTSKQKADITKRLKLKEESEE